MALSPVASPSAARARADRIRDGMEALAPDILAAWNARDWDALGYGSWNEYVVGEFGGQLRLGRAERQGAVRDLREAGMSTRAIGTALGVAPQTVINDSARVQSWTPDAAPVTGLDGKTYPAREPIQPVQAPRARLAVLVSGAMASMAELTEHEPAEVAALITHQRNAFAGRARTAGQYLIALADSIGGTE